MIKAHFRLLGLSDAQTNGKPVWWAIGIFPASINPELNKVSDINKIWGALGIIPQQLVDWLYANVDKTKDIPAANLNLNPERKTSYNK